MKKLKNALNALLDVKIAKVKLFVMNVNRIIQYLVQSVQLIVVIHLVINAVELIQNAYSVLIHYTLMNLKKLV